VPLVAVDNAEAVTTSVALDVALTPWYNAGLASAAAAVCSALNALLS